MKCEDDVVYGAEEGDGDNGDEDADGVDGDDDDGPVLCRLIHPTR